MTFAMQSSKEVPEMGTDIRPSRLIMPVLCIMLVLSLCPVISFIPEEVDMIDGGLSNPIYRRNILGYMGTKVGWFLLLTFGLSSFPTTALALISSFRRLLWRKGLKPVSWEYVLSFLLFGIGLSILLGIWPNGLPSLTKPLNISTIPGGVIGQRLSSPTGTFTMFMNGTGSAIVASILILVTLAIIWYFDWRDLFHGIRQDKSVDDSENELADVEEQYPENDTDEEEPRQLPVKRPKKQQQRKPDEKSEQQDIPVPQDTRPVQAVNNGKYTYPPLSLLDATKNTAAMGANAREIEENKTILQDVLDSFDINAKVLGTVVGPQVTLFEILPESGVRLSSITSLEKNFSMVLSAKSLRILAPIPGKNLVGIEVPNKNTTPVTVHSLMQDKAWTESRDQIPLLLGKNISGKTVILDLAKAPHLLIAGTTGSGKSVCMNLLITSLLFRFKPEDLRFIMVDPKVVEFQPYSTLPHLVVPIINEPSKVALALRWAINEMERRYRVFAKAGACRDLATFNKRPPLPPGSEPLLDEEGNPIPQKLPFIVIIIDEIADIMATAKVEVEQCLSRIAAKSRAVGIHTILATQRPDVKTLTGTIKSNYPVRIAFRAASQTDSQTIIGGKGAEALLGKGDMLFHPPGAMGLERIQCGMASDEERSKVVDFVSAQAPQNFDDSVIKAVNEPLADDNGHSSDRDSSHANNSGEGLSADEKLIQDAIELIIRDRRPTTSYIQRRLGIGYNKAASIMEELEKRGIVGPQIGTAPRQILVTSNETATSSDHEEEN